MRLTSTPRSRSPTTSGATARSGPPVCWDTDSVQAFDAMTALVRPDDLREAVLVSADPAQHAAWLVERAALGFDAVQIHHVGEDQPEFLDVFGAKVVPELRAGS